MKILKFMPAYLCNPFYCSQRAFVIGYFLDQKQLFKVTNDSIFENLLMKCLRLQVLTIFPQKRPVSIILLGT